MTASDIGGRKYGTTAVEVDDRMPITVSVASSATSIKLVDRNDNRRGLTIYNISTANLYLSFADPATTANCWVIIEPNGFLLLDQQLIIVNAIYAFWASASGTAQVTEYM
jgi:hypothetical protein